MPVPAVPQAAFEKSHDKRGGALGEQEWQLSTWTDGEVQVRAPFSQLGSDGEQSGPNLGRHAAPANPPARSDTSSILMPSAQQFLNSSKFEFCLSTFRDEEPARMEMQP